MTIGAHHSVGCDWGDNALALKQLQLGFEFVPICEGDCSGCVDTDWLGIICQRYVQLLTFHGFDLSVEQGWDSPIISSDMGVCFLRGCSKSALMVVGFG